MARDFYEMSSVDNKVKHDHEEKFNKNDFMCNKPKIKTNKTKYCNLPINFKKVESKSKNIIPVLYYLYDENGEEFPLWEWEKYVPVMDIDDM